MGAAALSCVAVTGRDSPKVVAERERRGPPTPHIHTTSGSRTSNVYSEVKVFLLGPLL